MKLVERMKHALGLKPEAVPVFEDEEKLEWPEGLPQQILTVEEAALEIYRRHGLPLKQGSYQRKSPKGKWKRLPDNMTPEEKWALYNSAPAGADWKFVTRASLGRHCDAEEAKQASTLLLACDSVRRRLEGKEPVTQKDLADALQLGTASALLIQARQKAQSQQTQSQQAASDYQPLVFLPVAEDAIKEDA